MSTLQAVTPIDVKAQAKNAPRKRAKKPNAVKKAMPLDIVSQVEMASDRKHRLAAIIGALFGGFVPVASYLESHYDLAGNYLRWEGLLVLGGLVYSATMVYGWAKMAVGSRLKALGFTVLLEGVMVFSGIQALALVALGYLAVINAVATGTCIALARERRAATETAEAS